jgi:hypothetical protein
MKSLKDAALAAWNWFRWVAGLALAVLAFFLIREKRTEDANTIAEQKRNEAEDAVRATPSRTVAERYEGVGDAIDAGRNRFATRVKTRVLAAGGRRIDEQHTE